MIETRYLIVGGGLTGDAACRGILDVDPDPDAVLLVSAEQHAPYARPPLSNSEPTTMTCNGPVGALASSSAISASSRPSKEISKASPARLRLTV